MIEWITKTEAMNMGLTVGQIAWRVRTGEIERHPDDRSLFCKKDVERALRNSRKPVKKTSPTVQATTTKVAAPAKAMTDSERTDKIARSRARLALEFCAHAMKKDGELGDLARRLFRNEPEKLIETAASFV